MRARWIVVVLAAMMAGSCGGAAGPQDHPAGSGGASASAPAATEALAMTPSAAAPSGSFTIAELVVERDIAYESSSELIAPGMLDVYAPPAASGLPVVVMLHGSPTSNNRNSLKGEAEQVAPGGYVVFVPSWDQDGEAGVTYPGVEEVLAANAQVSCAMAFARDHAAEYGGDPERIVLFGHSGGGNAASVNAFSPSPVSPGCLSDSGDVPIRGLVTWDGDFVTAVPDADAYLAADPRWGEQMMPWASLPARPDLRVELLVSSDPPAAFRRPLGPGEAALFMAARDPRGALANAEATVKALDDGDVTLVDEQLLLDAALRAQGNEGTLTVLPGTTHTGLGREAVPVLLAAIARALGS